MTAQLTEVLLVVFGSRMHLNRHVAVAVERIVVVEADGEVTAELLDGRAAHDGLALLLHEREIGEVDLLVPGLDDDRHLHRDQVEDPRAVAHRVGQVAEFLDVGAAPHALQIDRLAAERIAGQRPEDVGQRRHRDHVDMVGTVRSHVIVEQFAAQQLAAVAHTHLEIGVVAAADHPVGRAGHLVAQIGELAAADAEDGLLGRHVEVAFDVIEPAHLLDQTSAAVDEQHAPCGGRGPQRLEALFEGREFRRVEHIRVITLDEASEQQRRVLRGVPLQIGIDHVGDLLLGFEHLGKRHGIQFDPLAQQLLRKQVDHPGPVGRRIAVESDDDVPAGCGLQAGDDIPGQRSSSLGGSGNDRLDGFLGECRTIDGAGVVIRKRVIHETHKDKRFYRVNCLLRDIRNP